MSTKAILLDGVQDGEVIDLMGANPAPFEMYGPDNIRRLYRPRNWHTEKGETLLLVSNEITDEKIAELVARKLKL